MPLIRSNNMNKVNIVTRHELYLNDAFKGKYLVGYRYSVSDRETGDILSDIDVSAEHKDLFLKAIKGMVSEVKKGSAYYGRVSKSGKFEVGNQDYTDEATCIEDIQIALFSSLFPDKTFKYRVFMLEGKYFRTDNPKIALVCWFRYQIKKPTCAAITCGSKDDCMAIYKCFVKEFDWFRYIYKKDSPIKLDYLLGECNKYISGEKQMSSFRGKSDFFDMVYPFDLG